MLHSFVGNNTPNKPVLFPPTAHSVWIDEASRVGEARRMAVSLASLLGFSDIQQSNISIVITELANNILHHAIRGEIVLQTRQRAGAGELVILGLDKGPGMQSVSQCLEDGFSTMGTSGTGLGAIKRLSDIFEIYTQVDAGTAILSVFGAKSENTREPEILGVVNRPKLGEEKCGDSWAITQKASSLTFMVVDGLGHGPDAAQVAQEAVAAFHRHSEEQPGGILEKIHTALRNTRGAALAIASWSESANKITFAGIGNISGMVIQGNTTNQMMSHFGIVGYQVRKIQEFCYNVEEGAHVILSSDGITIPGSLTQYPGLWRLSPMLIAGILYRDFQRDTDDATILVLRLTGLNDSQGWYG